MGADSKALHLVETATPRVLTGDWLIENGYLSPAQLAICLDAQETMRLADKRIPIGEIIVRHGFAPRAAVELAIQKCGNVASGFTQVDLPYSLIREHGLKPVGYRAGVLHVASLQPLDDRIRQQIVAAVRIEGFEVHAVVEEPRDRREVLEYIHSVAHVDTETLRGEIRAFCANPDQDHRELLPLIIEHIFIDAHQARASDVHVGYSDEDMFNSIKYRIDGSLRHKFSLTSEAMRRLVTQIKGVAAPMDISERQRPQDGRYALRYHGRFLDLRVSTNPKDDGEKVVVRLLDQSKTLSISEMLSDYPQILAHLQHITTIKSKDAGFVLVTGPTGSGKSTTMTAMVQAMPRHELSIKTAEDPVEYRVPGVDHAAVNEAIGLTYSKLVRAMMRQDIDVAVIGEIRDEETAEIALRAVETGHLVLTTLHTKSVPESISRIVSRLPDNYRAMGVMALANNLKAVINQKLVKKLCICAAPRQANEDDAMHRLVRQALGLGEEHQFKTPVGCPLCEERGHRGRVMVPEAAFFASDENLRFEMESILAAGESASKLLSLPGVAYFPRIDAVKNLVLNGVIDAHVAAAALDLGMAG